MANTLARLLATSGVKFTTTALLATPGANAAFTADEQLAALRRHLSGDWGNLEAEDKAANNHALTDGSRLLSAYTIGAHKLWIVTEAEDDNGVRGVTTLLLPSEY